jgi:two-component system sensor histidine kinase EvgS
MGNAPIQAMLLETLGDMGRITVIPHSYDDVDLINGRVDAMSTYLSSEPFKLKKKGVAVNIIDPHSKGIDFYGDNLFTTEKEIKAHPERVKKMIRATLKGWAYALEHKEESIALIQKRYNPDIDQDQLRYEAKVIDQMILPDLVPIGEINPRRYERIAKIYHRLGMSQSSTVPDGFIYQAKPEPVVSLTAEERAWLKAHRDIRFVFSDNYPPIVIVGADGSLSGIMKDMLDLLNQRLGTDFAITTTSTKSLIEMVMTKKVAGQLVLTAGNGANRRLLETHNVLTSYPVVYARAGQPIRMDTLKDLEGKTVAILGGAYYAENVLEPFQNRINIVKTGTILEALKMLFEGKVDFMIGVSQHTYHIVANQLLGIEPVFVMTNRPINGVMGVRDDWPELVGIIDKGLQSIAEDERNAIYVKWVQLPSQKEGIEFTAEEKAWLKQDHTVRVRLAEHAPYLYSKDGKPVGIAVDLINAVSERTGIKFQFAMASPPFSADLKDLIQHEGPDVITSLNPTPEREKVILFTKPYVSSPRFIFTRDDAEFVASMENLSGKTVAVIKNYLVHKELAKNYPDINLLFCKNNEDALRAVSFGKAFAFIGGLLSTAVMINKFGLNNLKASAPSSLPVGTVAMGIRSDWPELRDIINKVFDSIPESEKTAIINKWSSVRIEHGIRPADVLKWILVVVGVASGILFLFVFWNRSLTKQVKERTGEIARSNESLKAEISERKNAEDELRMSRDYLKNLTNSMGDVVFSVRMPERKIEWVNDSSFNILGYYPEEIIGRTTEFLYRNRNEFLAFGDKLKGAVAEGKNTVHIAQFVRRKSGEAFPVELTVTIHKEKGEVVSSTVIVRDITERRHIEMALQKSRQHFQLLFERHHAVMLLIDPGSGKIVDANPAAATFYGYSRAELRAINIAAINQLDPEQITDKLQNAKTGTGNYFIFPHRIANGEIRTVEVYSTLIDFQDRKLLFSIIHDITERKQMEKALRESEEKFRSLVTNTEEIVYMINKDGTFLLSEGKGLAKLGLKPGQIVGKSVFELYKDYPQMFAEMRKTFNGETVTTEVNIGGIYFRNWYTPHKNHAGEIIGLLGLSINVTDQKQAEEALKAYHQRLKILASQLTITEEKERRRIAADLHDHVGQSLALARMQIASVRELGSDPRQTAILDEISDSLRQTVQETRDLIYDLSPPQLNEIGLSAAISEWLEEKVGKRYALKAECIVSVSEEPMDDDVRAILFRSVRELVANVIKHARATRVNIRVNQDNDRVKVIVRDDGAGFDANTISQSIKTEGGFGLFSIKERMADLGGSLEIISEPGKGTEAILAVPLEKEEDNEEIT